MSHMAAMTNIPITDLKALAQAAKALGLELRLGQKTHQWFGEWVNDYHGQNAAYKQGVNTAEYGKCEHAIVDPNNPNAYEVGVIRHPTKKGYALTMDFWGGGMGMVAKVGGSNCETLLQTYSAKAAKRQLLAEGWQVREYVDKQGLLCVEALG